MDNEIKEKDFIMIDGVSYVKPHFVVKADPQARNDVTLNEIHAEKIPTESVEKMNQPMVFLSDDIESVSKNHQENLEDEELIEIIPNAFSGMYVFISILMVMMIAISILGIILS